MRTRHHLRSILGASALTATVLSGVAFISAGCGVPDQPAGIDGGDDDPGIDADTGPKLVLKRPSKSSTVAITDDDAFVVMTNPEDDSVSIFRTVDNTRIAIVATGDEPSSVVIAPDSKTAYVANRGDATVVKISNIDLGTASVTATANVGSEPVGLALTPTGEHLFVAEYAEGTVSRITTATMADPGAGDLIEAPAYPRALIITNDGDQDENDELLVVPEFFGELATDGTNINAAQLDKSRTGRVRIYSVGTLAADDPITLAPFDSGAAPVDTGSAQFASPNQLWSVSLRRDAAAPDDSSKGQLYITSVSVSPQGPPRFNGNVAPIVYVGDLTTRTEVGGPAGTANLSKALFAASPNPAAVTGKLFLADLVDMSFLPNSTGESAIAYAVARGADVMQRIDFAATGTAVGSATNLQVDLIGAAGDVTAGCKAPTGIVVANNGGNAYINCWVSRRLAVVALGNNQSLTTTVEAVNPPSNAGAFPTPLDLTKGRRFFFTGRGRWSGNGLANAEPTVNNLAFSDCGSCHPDGLSDNVTWIFAAGPRQSTSMDGSFSHGALPVVQKQRVFNWTGIFDEIHDFERNTRGVSGGKGAITSAGTGACGALATEARKTLGGELAQPAKEAQDDDTVAATCVKDWDEIEAWSKTIRPPRGLKRLDATKVALGAAIFGTGDATDKASCVSCHGGPGWTVSDRYFAPSTAGNLALNSDDFTRGTPWPAPWNVHTFHLQNELGTAEVGPLKVACVSRRLLNTGTDTFGPAALEVKAGTGTVAQGAGGYNVPSLYGVALGAPYLHHGLAYASSGARASLEVLFTTPDWQDHYRAGNQNFESTNASYRAALIEFLLSIDASTTEQAIPAGYDKCP